MPSCPPLNVPQFCWPISKQNVMVVSGLNNIYICQWHFVIIMDIYFKKKMQQESCVQAKLNQKVQETEKVGKRRGGRNHLKLQNHKCLSCIVQSCVNPVRSCLIIIRQTNKEKRKLKWKEMTGMLRDSIKCVVSHAWVSRN